MPNVRGFFEQVGQMSAFGVASIGQAFRPPFEWNYFMGQVQEMGLRSAPLMLAAGLAVGVVTTFHTRSTLVQFGAEAMIPSLQSMSFFNELGPLLTGLLMAGRIGAGIGAELANMRATEQIDAIESLSIDSFKFLVVTRVLACIVVMPLLTIITNFAGLAGGFFSEHLISHISLRLYTTAAFQSVHLVNYIPPTLKTAVFGYLIGVVSCFYGFTINEGSDGVRRASTNSVVVSSMLIILSDVLLVKLIFFFSPENAL
jgi:phospholipid/cholesterol/gamma-HCH transport system permease protein